VGVPVVQRGCRPTESPLGRLYRAYLWPAVPPSGAAQACLPTCTPACFRWLVSWEQSRSPRRAVGRSVAYVPAVVGPWASCPVSPASPKPARSPSAAPCRCLCESRRRSSARPLAAARRLHILTAILTGFRAKTRPPRTTTRSTTTTTTRTTARTQEDDSHNEEVENDGLELEVAFADLAFPTSNGHPSASFRVGPAVERHRP